MQEICTGACGFFIKAPTANSTPHTALGSKALSRGAECNAKFAVGVKKTKQLFRSRQA
jgi:hypothetical protein